MVTIQDVAQAAGVSPMTVSNVLNERTMVRPETRAKVVDAIDRLGYRVNVAARNLRAGRTGTIGLALPDLDRPYNGQLAALIIHEGQRHGLRVVVEETGARRQDELDAIALSRVRLYDGLILSAVGLDSTDLAQMAASGPVVLLGERVSDSPADHVGVPNVAGAAAMTAHLLATRRRIAILGAPLGFHEYPDLNVVDAARLRIRGYRDELGACGEEYDPDLIVETDEWSTPAGWAATTQLLARHLHIDAIFGLSDSLALGALRALADAGIRVPQDVAVAGFDGLAEAQFSVPSLTTVAVDHSQIAELALRFLMERLDNDGEALPGRNVICDFNIAIRESTTMTSENHCSHLEDI